VRGDIAGKAGVTGAHRRNGLLQRHPHAVDARPALADHLSPAAIGHRHDRRARTQRDDLPHGAGAIGVIVELVANQLLASTTFGETTSGSARTGEPQRLAVGVDDRHHIELVHRADELRVEVGIDPAGQRSGEDDDRRSPRQIQELLAELLDLFGLHVGPAR